MGVGVIEPSNEELVARTVRGDRAAFGALYDRIAPEVQRFLLGLRLDLDRHRIEDAVQETFLRLHRVLAQFDASRPLRPFVLGVARRVALELERRARPTAPIELDSRPGHGTGVQEAALRAEEDALVARALVALPAEQRALMVFRFVNELTMQEVADALGCSVPTARSRLEEAGAAFSTALARAGHAPGGEKP
jgi:RNA polymerase sigma-70 factor (ECF subfamily)